MVATAKNAADGSVAFPITLHNIEKTTIFSYNLVEVAGDLDGVTYDSTVYKVSIWVIVNDDGSHSVSVNYQKGSSGVLASNVIFRNEVYTPENVTIRKAASPASGTASSPAKLFGGDSLNYTLTIKNTHTRTDVENVEVTDILPDEFVLAVGEVAYQYSTGGNTVRTKIQDSTDVTMTRQGQKLTFHIPKLLAGQELKLFIPGVSSNEPEDAGAVLENTATITKINNQTV